MACNIPCINTFSICQNSKSTSRIAFHRFVDGARFSPRRLMKRSLKMKAKPLRAHTESQQQLEQTSLEHDDQLKTQLMKSFDGTDMGLNASSETRAEVLELIARLEAENPTPAPSEALNLLDGKWILAYTSCVGLFPFLDGTFPFPKIEEISQTIDSANFTVQNSVLFSGPLTTTSVSANAKFEVRSPKRVQIKFEEGVIGTPQLTDSVLLPEKLEFLGQEIDLTPFKDFLTSTQDTANLVANAISGHPPLKFPISHAESWLLTTYLDPELRVSRGDGGTVFVLIKHLSNH